MTIITISCPKCQFMYKVAIDRKDKVAVTAEGMDLTGLSMNSPNVYRYCTRCGELVMTVKKGCE